MPVREIVGVALFVLSVVAGIYLFREKTVDWKGFLAITAICLLGGVLIAELPYIRQLAVTGGDGKGITVDIQQQVNQVETRAKEVEAIANELRDIKGQVQLLVNTANMTNDKIKTSEESVGKLVKQADQTKEQIESVNKQVQTANTQAQGAVNAVRAVEANVGQMRDNVRQTWRSLLESYAYAMGTRNLFPPPDFVSKEIDRHMNILATFAWPDQQERNREIGRIMATINRAQNPGK